MQLSSFAVEFSLWHSRLPTDRYLDRLAATVVVMYEYRFVVGEHIVRVDVADGEVVDRCGGGGPAVDGGDLNPGAGACVEPLARLQVGGVQPLAEFGYRRGGRRLR